MWNRFRALPGITSSQADRRVAWLPSARPPVEEEPQLNRKNDRAGQQRVTVTEWLAVVLDASGKRQFLGLNTRSGAPFTTAPGNAIRYNSENAALHAAYSAKESDKWITDVRAESISVRKWVPVLTATEPPA